MIRIENLFHAMEIYITYIVSHDGDILFRALLQRNKFQFRWNIRRIWAIIYYPKLVGTFHDELPLEARITFHKTNFILNF